VCFLAGISAGLILYGRLSGVFQRSANEAFTMAYEKAYRDYFFNIQDRDKKKREAEDSPAGPLQHPEETMKSFEEAVATMYPNDKDLQAKLIEQRKVQAMAGR